MGISYSPGAGVAQVIGAVNSAVRHSDPPAEADSTSDPASLHILQGGLPTREDAQSMQSTGLPVLRGEGVQQG